MSAFLSENRSQGSGVRSQESYYVRLNSDYSLLPCNLSPFLGTSAFCLLPCLYQNLSIQPDMILGVRDTQLPITHYPSPIAYCWISPFFHVPSTRVPSAKI